MGSIILIVLLFFCGKNHLEDNSISTKKVV